MRPLRLVVLVFQGTPELHGDVLLFVVDCLLFCECYIWSYWFSKNVLNFTGVCYFFVVGCLLLGERYVWSYWFSKNVLNFDGGVLLFVVGCLLLGECYAWLYWFLTLLVVYAFCTASGCRSWLLTGLLGLYEGKFFPFLTFW